MISSTSKDLIRHRTALLRAIDRAHLKPIAMEHASAMPDGDVIDSSLKMVRDSAGYVCVIGQSYGQTPHCDVRNPDRLSLTELEFNEARRLALPLLLFIMGDEHNVKPRHVERDLENMRKLAAFRETAKRSEDGSAVHRVYHIFNDLHEFELAATQSAAELRQHLEDLAAPHDGYALERSSASFKALFAVPEFHDAAGRVHLRQSLIGLMRAHPVVVVGGISGSGKSNLAATTVQQMLKAGEYTGAIWHEPLADETLDAFISKLDPNRAFTGLSVTERARQLMASLADRNELLVIEDFHAIDRGTYQAIVTAATRLASPARLLLISQMNVGMQGSIPNLPHLEVPPLTTEELAQFLKHKANRQLSAALLTDLLEKTEGLPVAIDFFLVRVQLGSSPESLLKGNMLVQDRMREWFKEVEDLSTADESKLLGLLSLCEGPFNMGVVHALCRHASITAVEDVFEKLQRRYLVQKYSPFRWKLHHIVKMLCGVTLPEQQKREIHGVLGRYFLKTARRIVSKYAPARTFLWRLTACAHLRKAGEYAELAENLCNMAKHTKHRGYYDMFIQLAMGIPQAERDGNKWLLYHLAHCCLITGQFKASLSLLEPLLYETTLPADLRVSIGRLHAEVLEATGHSQDSLTRLQELRDKFREPATPKQVLAHLRTVEIRVLTSLGRHTEAMSMASNQLAATIAANDKRGQAIALTAVGIIHWEMHDASEAEKQFRKAVRLFKDDGDNRGLAWASTYRAFCLYQFGSTETACRLLCQALRIKSEINEVSTEYQRLLTLAAARFDNDLCRQWINAESARVSARLLDAGGRALPANVN